jgi:hypothetical protein
MRAEHWKTDPMLARNIDRIADQIIRINNPRLHQETTYCGGLHWDWMPGSNIVWRVIKLDPLYWAEIETNYLRMLDDVERLPGVIGAIVRGGGIVP